MFFANLPGATSPPILKGGTAISGCPSPPRQQHHRFSSALFSSTYKPLVQQLLCFHIYTKPRGCGGVDVDFSTLDVRVCHPELASSAAHSPLAGGCRLGAGWGNP